MRREFHASKLRWGSERTRRLLERLGPIPTRCGLQRLLGGVRVRDYEDLVAGTPAEERLSGYQTALFPAVIQALRFTPRDEFVSFILEEQKQYARDADLIFRALRSIPYPEFLTVGGRSKLARWTLSPKGSTPRTQPADMFVNALGHLWRDKTSKKTRWCLPVLGDESSESVGKIMSREEIRSVVRLNALAGVLPRRLT